MYTKEQLIQDLKNLGLQATDTVLVHSSMKAMGEVEGGADTALDALQEVVSEGMLVLPTHTWATMTEEHNLFDPETEPACVGILPNLFRKRPGVIRSLHPTHSVAAWCKDREKLVKFTNDEECHSTPCPRKGCYGKLYDLNAKILLLGVKFNRNTYLHGVEEWFGIGERLTDFTLPLEVVLPDGTRKATPMHKHFKPNNISISEYYGKLEPDLLKADVMKIGKVGNAECRLMKAKELADIATEYLKKERDYFTYWDEAEI